MLDKQELQKKVIKLFHENPIVQIACHKAGVSRSTFYRWCKEDPQFKKICARALRISLDIANDSIESVLYRKAREGDMKAIPYWLSANSKKYKKSSRGYNEQHFIILRELNEKKQAYDNLIEKETNDLIKLFNAVKKSPQFEELNTSSDNYLEGLVSA